MVGCPREWSKLGLFRLFRYDWNPPKSELANKVLLPFLPDQFGLVLESQAIKTVYDAGIFSLDSQGTLYPLAPRSWALLLERVLQKVKERLPAADDYLLELESISPPFLISRCEKKPTWPR